MSKVFIICAGLQKNWGFRAYLPLSMSWLLSETKGSCRLHTVLMVQARSIMALFFFCRRRRRGRSLHPTAELLLPSTDLLLSVVAMAEEPTRLRSSIVLPEKVVALPRTINAVRWRSPSRLAFLQARHRPRSFSSTHSTKKTAQNIGPSPVHRTPAHPSNQTHRRDNSTLSVTRT